MTVASQARPSLEVMEIGDALETILLVLAADKAALQHALVLVQGKTPLRSPPHVTRTGARVAEADEGLLVALAVLGAAKRSPVASAGNPRSVLLLCYLHGRLDELPSGRVPSRWHCGDSFPRWRPAVAWLYQFYMRSVPRGLVRVPVLDRCAVP